MLRLSLASGFVLLLVLPLLVTAPGPASAEEAQSATHRVVATDPTKNEVSLPAQSGWKASLILDNKDREGGPVGIWTVKPFQVFEHLACPEVVGLDDKGRCHVMMSYSGKWTPITIVHDGKWLGGLDHGDVDPRFAGAETYVGSQRGHIYQILAYPETALDCRLIARIPGREIHTIVAGDLDPRTEGRELLVFTRPGGLYRLTPDGPHGGFTLTHLEDLAGRVRDAVVLPTQGSGSAAVATVSRTGALRILRILPAGPTWEEVYKAPMGMGRIAVAPLQAGRGLVLYSTHDDGRILRHARSEDGAWHTEVIYRGPQGPRGIAAGRFHEDPNAETIAIFGYSKNVELLTRGREGWTSEVLFTDRDKGHWLSVAEVDGRNATQELVASGYGARMVLLSRPPGYGTDSVTEAGAPD
jgi:hypothetical protein